jgi:hypothetical protein
LTYSYPPYSAENFKITRSRIVSYLLDAGKDVFTTGLDDSDQLAGTLVSNTGVAIEKTGTTPETDAPNCMGRETTSGPDERLPSNTPGNF